MQCGWMPGSGLYYEVLGGDTDAEASPWVFVHGGGATGACFRTTADGRPGWAERLAGRGIECWVTDWPGVGRSGGRDPLTVRYDDLVEGYTALLTQVVRRPAVVVCHSMGGALTWKVVERTRPHVAAVVGLAASHPGNIAPVSEVVSDDGTTLVARFAASGVSFVVARDRLYRYDDAYLLRQAIAGSTQFPLERLDAFRAGLVGIPPQLLLQRLGLAGGLPAVDDPTAFRGLPVRLFAGTEDPAHTREIDGGTAALLREWDADAELVWLGDHGQAGNGHFLYAERNSDAVLDLIVEELERAVTSRP